MSGSVKKNVGQHLMRELKEKTLSLWHPVITVRKSVTYREYIRDRPLCFEGRGVGRWAIFLGKIFFSPSGCARFFKIFFFLMFFTMAPFARFFCTGNFLGGISKPLPPHNGPFLTMIHFMKWSLSFIFGIKPVIQTKILDKHFSQWRNQKSVRLSLIMITIMITSTIIRKYSKKSSASHTHLPIFNRKVKRL